MRIGLGTVLFVATLVAAPANAQSDGRQTVERILADFAAAFNAKDAVKLAALYADDGVLMPLGAPVLRGRAAIQQALQAMVARGGVLMFNPPIEAEIVGNRAFAAGTYTVTVANPNVPSGTAASQVFAAKYLTVFKRVGNDWKVAYDMQNADAVAPPR
jgi:uncharacterized protein (TIGR02246 family)